MYMGVHVSWEYARGRAAMRNPLIHNLQTAMPNVHLRASTRFVLAPLDPLEVDMSVNSAQLHFGHFHQSLSIILLRIFKTPIILVL